MSTTEKQLHDLEFAAKQWEKMYRTEREAVERERGLREAAERERDDWRSKYEYANENFSASFQAERGRAEALMPYVDHNDRCPCVEGAVLHDGCECNCGLREVLTASRSET